MRIHKLSCLLLFLLITSGAFAQNSRDQNRSPLPEVAIAENGIDGKGNKLYGVVGNGQGIAEVLRALFAKSGDQYVIDEDVSGTVDISVRGATIEQVLQRIAEAARPPLRIRADGKGVYKVSRELVAQPAGINLSPGAAAPPGIVPGANGMIGGYQQFAVGNRPVTLVVPKEKPIPLADALSQISRQTGFPITLDRRLPRDVEFIGKIENAPLSVVLAYIADASKLKLTMNAVGASFSAPDWFIIRVRDVILGNSMDSACPGCGERINGEWRYCPHCSRKTPAGVRDIDGKGQQQKRPNRAGKIGGY